MAVIATPQLPPATVAQALVADTPVTRPVLSSTIEFHGRVWDIAAEDVELPGDVVVRREFMAHTGAVAVIAIDHQGRVLLQSQYRHPVRRDLWEPPAGLLDVAGEPPVETAQRELFEEADLQAADWRRLIAFFSTPGGCNEVIQIFLARDLTEVPPAERFERADEEATMVPAWVPLDEAAGLVLGGALHSPTSVVGILAALRTRDLPGGWDALPRA
ncbi:MAG: NUDIX hydrolase [Bifidobacteriaceae bacterium]|nr:NUDIX hydrolase [Bifidobacteriaceae bacterium]